VEAENDPPETKAETSNSKAQKEITMKKLALNFSLSLVALMLAATFQQVMAQQLLAEWQGTATGTTANQNFRLPVTVRLYGKINQYDPNPYNVFVAIGGNTVQMGAALNISAVYSGIGQNPLQFMRVSVENGNTVRATLVNTNTGQAGAVNTFYPRNVSSQAWAWHGAISSLWEKVFQYQGGVEISYFLNGSQVVFQLRGNNAQEIVGEMRGIGGSATGTAGPVGYYAVFQARRVR
jgi:hypothetical protein